MNKLKILFLSLVCVIFSCNDATIDRYKIENISIKAEGPLFEGSNTIQGDFEGNLLKFAKEKGIQVEQLEAIKLKSIKLTAKDSLNFDNISNIKLQIVSEVTDMMDLGIINPIPLGQHSIELNKGGDQSNLLELLKEKKITIVADVNFKKELEDNIEWIVDFEFDLSYKK